MDFHQIIDNVYPLPDVAREKLAAEIDEIKLEKNTTLLRADKVETHIYFIKQGVVRHFPGMKKKRLLFGLVKKARLFCRCGVMWKIKRDMKMLNYWKIACCTK